ncbi:hypothetical protein ACXR2U_10885 [Jatrophihabitans sp. YIM 134969]
MSPVTTTDLTEDTTPASAPPSELPASSPSPVQIGTATALELIRRSVSS